MKLLRWKWQLPALRAFFSVLGRVAPGLTSHLGGRIFTSPRRIAPPLRETTTRQWAQKLSVPFESGDLALFHWKSSKTSRKILLMHGWEGRGTDLRAFVKPLQKAGFSVFALDAPAHGESAGRQACMLAFSASLRAASKSYGPFHSVIAHSLGGNALFHAMAHGMEVERPVVIGAPFCIPSVIRRVMAYLGLSRKIQKKIVGDWRLEYGEEYDELSPNFYLPLINHISLLIIHDENDGEIPIRNGERIAEAFPNSQMMRTQELGHHGVLHNPAVMREVLRFIAKRQIQEQSIQEHSYRQAST